MGPWIRATAPLVAARLPCGHPPLQRRSRWRRDAVLWAREEHPRRLEAVLRLRRHSGCLPRLCGVAVQRELSGLKPLTTRVLRCFQVYHSGLKLDDPLTKERSHDYLLFTSPRKVSRQ